MAVSSFCFIASAFFSVGCSIRQTPQGQVNNPPVNLGRRGIREVSLKSPIIHSDVFASRLPAAGALMEFERATHEMIHELGMNQRNVFIAISAVFAVVILAVACNFMGRRIIGGCIEGAISELAPALLGVPVTFEKLHVAPLMGRVHVSKMIVCNPSATPPYTTPYLFCADEVVADLDMMKLLCTAMNHIQVQELCFNGVRFVYERPELLSNKSNVGDVKDHLEQVISNFRGGDAENPPASIQTAEQDTKQDAKQDMLSKSKGKTRAFIINKLSVAQNGADAKIKGVTSSLTIAPIKSEDFSKECRGTGIKDVVVALVEKFGESLLSSAQTAIEAKVHSTEESVMDAVHSTEESVKAAVEGAVKRVEEVF